MQPEEKQKKKWKTPHTFVILVAIIIIAAIATYLIPAGEFTRFKDAATGKTLVEAGSYHRIASNPLNPLLIPSAIYTGIVKSASTITFMLIIGGAFEVITSTGALTALCKKLSKTFSKHKYAVIPVFLTLFSIFGFTMGMSSEVMIFVPIGITLALFLGLDKVTGTAMIALGAAVGFTAGILNPFNVGVAQDIAELPLFSGMAYRIVILVILLVATSAYIIIYAKKVGLDTKTVLDAISKGAAGSWQMQNNGYKMIEKDYAPGFFNKHFIKDMKIANQGGLVVFRYVIEDLGNYTSNEDGEINHNELLKKLAINNDDLKFNVSFDININLDSNKSYKANVNLELPIGNVVDDGIQSKENTDSENIVFKRM